MFLSLSWAGSALAVPDADLWEIWQAQDPTSNVQVDHSAWQSFLDRYLLSGGNGILRVDYAIDPSQRTKLDDYLTMLQALDPRTLNRHEQLAYWINLYNAMTIEVVLENPQKGSILRMGRGLFSIGPWDDPVLRIAGESLTLNDVEHRILRPIWHDHRIHYALNCASLGCPNLNPEAYTAVNAETLMAQSEADYIRHPRGVSFSDQGRLQLSSIFKWYQHDFAADEAGLLDYLARHNCELRERLRSYDGPIDYRYDWNLNRAVPR